MSTKPPISPSALTPLGTTGNAPAAGGAARPSVIQLAIKEKAALYAAYIPQFTDGGIFIPSNKDYKLKIEQILGAHIGSDRPTQTM